LNVLNVNYWLFIIIIEEPSSCLFNTYKIELVRIIRRRWNEKEIPPSLRQESNSSYHQIHLSHYNVKHTYARHTITCGSPPQASIHHQQPYACMNECILVYIYATFQVTFESVLQLHFRSSWESVLISSSYYLSLALCSPYSSWSIPMTICSFSDSRMYFPPSSIL